MTINKAKHLIQIDHSTLSETELQKYKVQLLDAWRYARGDYGYGNGFFVYVQELKAFTPKDYWLLKNIESKLDQLGL